VLARWQFRGKTLFDALVHLPLLMPPVLSGYALLVLLGKQGALGRVLYEWFGVSFAFRWTGAVIAAAVMAFPLFVRSIRLSIEAIPRESMKWPLRSGASLADLLAGGAAAVAARRRRRHDARLRQGTGRVRRHHHLRVEHPGETQTIALAMQTLTQTPGGDAGIWRLAIVSLALSIGALLASEWMVRHARYRQLSE
jgi:molybdate transport system permease protein